MGYKDELKVCKKCGGKPKDLVRTNGEYEDNKRFKVGCPCCDRWECSGSEKKQLITGIREIRVITY